MPHGKVINGVLVSINDLNQRYQHTYIDASLRGEAPKIIKILGFDSGATPVSDVVYVADKQGDSVVPLSELTIVREFPEMGACNIGPDVFFVSLVPERQWQRGLSKTRITSYCRNQFAKSLESRLSLDIADSLFNRKYFNQVEGLKLLKSGARNGFAMNSRYWYSGNRKKIYMWRDKVCLGELVGGTLFFFEPSSTFITEIERELGKLYESKSNDC